MSSGFKYTGIGKHKVQLTGFERAVAVLERPKPRLQLLNKVENVHVV